MGRGATLGLTIGLVATACAPAPRPATPEPAPASAGWQALAESPLAARYDAHAFWTGREVLVLGGTDAPPCPPNADCAPSEEPAFPDGALLDPATGGWRRIAEAPVPLGHATGAVADGVLYLWVPGLVPAPEARPAFLAYRIADDRWTELALPPAGAEPATLVATGSTLVAYHGSQEFGVTADLAYDPARDAWVELPTDPLAPAYDRTAVWTGRELVLLGIRLDPARPPNAPPVYSAASWDPASGGWRRLPESEIAGHSPGWWWAGGSVVNPSIGSADGGETNGWGRPYPFGGVLTPPAGEWSDLPNRPDREGAYRQLTAGGGEHAVADGWVLHVPSGRWTELTRPADSADVGQAVVWAGDRLVIWGGIRWVDDRPRILASGWSFTP